jgi:hypothetical protein
VLKLEKFYIEIQSLKAKISLAINNLQYVENPEYWG